MKKHNKLLAMLMALAMVFAYMPAMAFADSSWSAIPKQEDVTLNGGTVESPGTAELEVEITNGDYSGDYSFQWFKTGEGDDVLLDGNTEIIEVNAEGHYYCVVTDAEEDYQYVDFYVERELWRLDYTNFVIMENGSATLKVDIDGSPYGLSYQWHRWDSSTETDIPITGETTNTLTVTEEGWYDCLVKYDDNDYTWAEIEVVNEDWVEPDYFGVSVGGIWYELHSTDESFGADAWGDGASGAVTIPASITLRNGKSYQVRYLYNLGPNVTSVDIPTSVTNIYELGTKEVYNEATDTWSLIPVPGFVIFGTNGSPAQVYANKYGITFRDLAAEAEAARQGTVVAGLPKIKISKPSAAKKSVTVKWKKLDKKQLKKGVTNVEVWVCPNAGFGAGDTIIKFAGKKKASLKVKGLAKGTYFVKVRAIKNVGGVKYYTAWSKVKKVKVKK